MQEDQKDNWLLDQIRKAEVPLKPIDEFLQEKQELEWTKRITDNDFYKRTFGDNRLSKELLSKLLPEHALQLLDLSELERKPETVHNFAGSERRCDMVFTAPYKNNAKKFAIIEIEFQSTPESNFSWRMFEYKCALLNGLQERHPKEFKNKKLPHVYMLAYYNGKSNWNAPLNTLDLFADPEDGERAEDALNSAYYLFDVLHHDPKAFEKADDLTSLIFRIEQTYFLTQQKEKDDPLRVSDQVKTLKLVLEAMALAKKLADRNLPEEERVSGQALNSFMLWCDKITLEFAGIRAYLLRKEPEVAMNNAMSFFQKVKAQSEAQGEAKGEARGVAKGEAQNAASTVFRLFNMLFNTDAPEKLVQLVTMLMEKRDLKSLNKLQEFIVLRKGSKDDLLRYAESLEA